MSFADADDGLSYQKKAFFPADVVKLTKNVSCQ
jgi:hypothetical protein